jgi:hypothetical protein
MLITQFAGGLIGCSQCDTFTSLMICRVIQSFGSGVCEALPVQLVNDIFFIHERGKRLGYYTVALCLGSTGPIYAGYMLAGGYSWRLFFYVEFAFAMALVSFQFRCPCTLHTLVVIIPSLRCPPLSNASLTICQFILAFFFVEETAYDREAMKSILGSATVDLGEKSGNQALEEVPTNAPGRKSFVSTLKPWSRVYEGPFIMVALRSFTYFLVPSVFWVITTYGIMIGLGALAFNYTFPILITSPPYNWSPNNSGLIAVGTAIGYFLAIPFTTSSDRLAARLTKKNNMIREAEMRLGVLLIPLLVGPASLVLYGYAAEKKLHWISYFVATAMSGWHSYFFFTFTLAYAVDSYTANISEMLIAMNLGKQAISFAMGIYLLEWILEIGYVKMIGGIFCGILLINNLATIPFMIWGKKIRVATSKTWLAQMHRRTAVAGESH